MFKHLMSPNASGQSRIWMEPFVNTVEKGDRAFKYRALLPLYRLIQLIVRPVILIWPLSLLFIAVTYAICLRIPLWLGSLQALR
jgi:hypothetical protein